MFSINHAILARLLSFRMMEAQPFKGLWPFLDNCAIWVQFWPYICFQMFLDSHVILAWCHSFSMMGTCPFEGSYLYGCLGAVWRVITHYWMCLVTGTRWVCHFLFCEWHGTCHPAFPNIFCQKIGLLNHSQQEPAPVRLQCISVRFSMFTNIQQCSFLPSLLPPVPHSLVR